MIERVLKVKWTVAYRKIDGNTLLDGNLKTPFTPIKNSSRYWCADPFAVEENGITYLFFEMYDRLKRKGLIGYRTINENGKIGKMKKIYECNCHLSFPYLFKYNGDYYIIPESNQNKNLMLLKATNFPNEWKLERLLIEDIRLADSNYIINEKGTYMLATEISDNDNVSTLYKFKYSGEKFERIADEALINDKSIARNAGKIHIKDGKVLRISQDCSNGYGYGINIIEVLKINDIEYREELIKKIYKNDVNIKNEKAVDGIHTYNKSNKYEFIDFKKDNNFNVFDIIGCTLSKLIGLLK